MPHIYLDNNYYFITSKTFLGEKLFDTDVKKQIIKNQIIKAQKKFNIKLFGYSIVSNHYHLLFYIDQASNIGRIIQLINGGSSKILNSLENINRSTWSGYWDRVIRDENSFLRILGYIIGNSYKHGVVKGLQDLEFYPFCNYRNVVKKYGRDYANELINQSIFIDLEEEWQFDKVFNTAH